MADKAISELIAAEQITPTDNLVVEQNNTAKRLPGQVLLNFLVATADGHGGIQKIEKTKTQGLVDTYTITLADTTTFSFNVSNGNGIESISKTGTAGLVDTYKISFTDGTIQTYTLTNGAKGDKGDNAYIWIKWASQKPTASSHDFGDVLDNWMGVYSGNSASAPTDWQSYDWFEVKGEKGNTGEAADLIRQEIVYQVSESGTIYPSGAWSETIPVVPSGKYLWTRVTLVFNTGDPVISYSVGRMGIDGTGAVSTVNNVSPDSNGNVSLQASDLNALPTSGGSMTGQINMNGQPLCGLNYPTETDQPATKGYVDCMKSVTVTLLAAGWTGTGSYTQSVSVTGMTAGWKPGAPTLEASGDKETDLAAQEAFDCVSLIESDEGTLTFTCYKDMPGADFTVCVPGVLK